MDNNCPEEKRVEVRITPNLGRRVGNNKSKFLGLIGKRRGGKSRGKILVRKELKSLSIVGGSLFGKSASECENGVREERCQVDGQGNVRDTWSDKDQSTRKINGCNVEHRTTPIEVSYSNPINKEGENKKERPGVLNTPVSSCIEYPNPVESQVPLPRGYYPNNQMNTSAPFQPNTNNEAGDLPFQPSLNEENVVHIHSGQMEQDGFINQWAQTHMGGHEIVPFGLENSLGNQFQQYRQAPSSSFFNSEGQGSVWAYSWDSDPINEIIDWPAFWESYWGEGVNLRRDSPQGPLNLPGYNYSLQTGSSSSYHSLTPNLPTNQFSNLPIFPYSDFGHPVNISNMGEKIGEYKGQESGVGIGGAGKDEGVEKEKSLEKERVDLLKGGSDGVQEGSQKELSRGDGKKVVDEDPLLNKSKKRIPRRFLDLDDPENEMVFKKPRMMGIPRAPRRKYVVVQALEAPK